jgi:hypothetical protein
MAWSSHVAVAVAASMPALTRSTKPFELRKSKSPWKFARPCGIEIERSPSRRLPSRNDRGFRLVSSCVTIRISDGLVVLSAGFSKLIVYGSASPAGRNWSTP